MSAVLPALSTFPHESGQRRSFSRSLVWRMALLAGSVAAGLAASAAANPAALGGVESDLVVLLRGMALIKGSLAVVAVATAYWRFGQPVPSRVAAGYVLGVWSLVAASVLIWYLSFIPAAAALFHLGLVGLLILGWREGAILTRPASAASPVLRGTS